ncbi:MAG: 3'-5' exonuclease [Clostridium sp.]
MPDQVLQNPRTASKEELESYEEERRLFYVGITRAKNQLNVFTMKPQKVRIFVMNYLVGRS